MVLAHFLSQTLQCLLHRLSCCFAYCSAHLEVRVRVGTIMVLEVVLSHKVHVHVHTDSTISLFLVSSYFPKSWRRCPHIISPSVVVIRFIFAPQASPWRSVVASLSSARVGDKKVQQAIPVDSLQFVYLHFKTCSQFPNFTAHASHFILYTLFSALRT